MGEYAVLASVSPRKRRSAEFAVSHLNPTNMQKAKSDSQKIKTPTPRKGFDGSRLIQSLHEKKFVRPPLFNTINRQNDENAASRRCYVRFGAFFSARGDSA